MPNISVYALNKTAESAKKSSAMQTNKQTAQQTHCYKIQTLNNENGATKSVPHTVAKEKKFSTDIRNKIDFATDESIVHNFCGHIESMYSIE